MEQDYVEELKESRKKSSSILTKYIIDHDKYPDKIFCFFEGEDYKYYRTRITQYLEIEEEEIFHYDCNGKKEVLKVYEDLIDQNVKKIFFIDKDFDETIDKENLFQTDGYSIENYYVTDSAFSHFLSTEFELNISDDNFKICLDDYKKQRKEFNDITTMLNAYICYIRQRDKNNETRIKLPNEKEILNKIIKNIGVRAIVIEDEKTIEDIKYLLNDDRPIDEKQILLIANKFEKLDKKEMIFRGKFEFYFLKKFVSSLINEIKNDKYFEDYDNSISLDINLNPISYFSTYADTSKKLKEFLLNIRKKYDKK